MSLIKVPLFSGLNTNSDPEDIRNDLTPDTENFDISQDGLIKRRDESALITTSDDRGVNSAYLWSNSSLPDSLEWIVYCQQRGILYRNNFLWQTIPLDSYDGLMAQFQTSNAPSINSNVPFSTYLKILPDPLPTNLTFTSVGSLVFVNTGKDHSPYIIHRTKGVKHFQNNITVDDATYIEPFDRGYPTTFGCAISTNTNGGTLPDGTYQYNVAPIYDGVNELPLKDVYAKTVTLGSGANQQVNIQVTLDKRDYYRSLSGLSIYRSFTDTGSSTPTSFRRTKRINIGGAIGTNDQQVSRNDIRTSQYITYCQNGFPTVDQIKAKWDGLHGSGDFDSSNKFYSLKNAEGLGDSPSNQQDTYTDPDTGITYYWDTTSTSYDSGNQLWSRNIASHYNGSFLDGDNRRILSNFIPENIAQGSPGAFSFRKDGETIVMEIYEAGSSNVAYFPLHGCYMGTDKLYSPTADLFSLLNNYSGQTIDITYTNNSGTTVNCDEEILAHDQRMVMVNTPQSGLSSDMETMTFENGGNGSTTTNGIAPRTVTLTTRSNLVYSVASNTIQITYTDKGDSVGSLPVVPAGSNIDLAWEHSVPHGGRLFVGNVMLDTRDSREVHEDMICFSELGQPAVIPISNFIQIKDPQGGAITGMQSLGDSLVILMENGTYRLKIPSVDPTTYSIMESHEQIGCIAPKSVVKVEDVIYFCGRGNIYKLDGSFLVDEIGKPILNKYLDTDSKKDTVATYDPVKEMVLFRLGKTKKNIYEYNIRSGLWNRIKCFGAVSHMEQGYNGEVYFFDNTQLSVARLDGASIVESGDVTIDETTDLGETDTEWITTIALREQLADEDENHGGGTFGLLQNGYYFLNANDFDQTSFQNYYIDTEYVPIEILADNVVKTDGTRVVIGKLKTLNRSALDDGSYLWNQVYNQDTASNPQMVDDLRETLVIFPLEQMGELIKPYEPEYFYSVGDFETWSDPYGNEGSDLSKLVILKVNKTSASAPVIVSNGDQGQFDVSFYIKYSDILSIKRWSDIYDRTNLSGDSGVNGAEKIGSFVFTPPTNPMVNGSTAVTSDESNIHLPYWGKVHTATSQNLQNLWNLNINTNPTKRAGQYMGIVEHNQHIGLGETHLIKFQVWIIYYPDGNGQNAHKDGVWRPLKNASENYQNIPFYTYFYRQIENITTGEQLYSEIDPVAYTLHASDGYLAYNPFVQLPINLVEIPGINQTGSVVEFDHTENNIPTKGYWINLVV